MNKPALTIAITFFLFGISIAANSQSPTNLDSLISANLKMFKGGNQFSGSGWDQLIEKAQASNYVLIGEDHFISEVPLFTKALVQKLGADNYICEMDPWMMTIFTNKINKLPPAELNKWVDANYNGFSFFQKKNEFELMRSLIDRKVNLIGLEQIGLMSTTIILQHLIETGSAKNKKLYETMRDSSTTVNDRFFQDHSKTFFILTPFFAENIARLDRSVMKPGEAEIIDALQRSAEIYKTGSHRNRIKLMQSNFMRFYPQMKGKKNVFKFGANHAMKGESYIPVYDIGTTANVVAQSENQDSYHIFILPRAGRQAGFIRGDNAIDFKDEFYGAMKPFFDKGSETEWTFIDLAKVRSAIQKSGTSISNTFLEKTIKGYDAFVIIPVATPAEAVR